MTVLRALCPTGRWYRLLLQVEVGRFDELGIGDTEALHEVAGKGLSTLPL